MSNGEPIKQSTVHPFTVKLEDGTLVGGSYDNLSAVTIAAAVYQARQGGSGGSDPDFVVTVFDSADVEIAIIGPFVV